MQGIDLISQGGLDSLETVCHQRYEQRQPAASASTTIFISIARKTWLDQGR